MSDKQTICDPKLISRFLQDELTTSEKIEFESHLDTCTSCRKKLSNLAANETWWQETRDFLDFDGTSAHQGIEETLSFLNPSDNPRMLGRFGGYEIAGLIGQGGMGIVLKGFDESLNRYAAIKVLAPQLATRASSRNRFAREAQAAAAVVHDNVIAIHGVSESAGLPFLVMPYVRGESLQKRLDREGALSPKEIVRIAHQIASGLAAAHAQGLIHRDIKPANILLPEGIERVLITDFGLARTVNDSNLTGTGTVAGTPQFMSPEQAMGENLDSRSDLFSLGTVMYVMCTGRNPFRAENPFSVLARITKDDPRPVNQVNNDIPIWLQTIVQRLHSKSPDNRIQSAKELAALLEKCLAHLQDPANPLPESLKSPERNSIPKKWIFGAALVPFLIWFAFVVAGQGSTSGWLAKLGWSGAAQIENSDQVETSDQGNQAESSNAAKEAKGGEDEITQEQQKSGLDDQLQNQEDGTQDEPGNLDDYFDQAQDNNQNDGRKEKARTNLRMLSSRATQLLEEGDFLAAKSVEKAILILLQGQDPAIKELEELRNQMIDHRLNGLHKRAEEVQAKMRTIETELSTRYQEIERIRQLEKKANEKLSPLKSKLAKLQEAERFDDVVEIQEQILAAKQQLETEFFKQESEQTVADTQQKTELLHAVISNEKARREVARLNSVLAHTQALVKKGFADKSQFESAKGELKVALLELEKAEILLDSTRHETAMAERNVKINRTYIAKLFTLRNELKELTHMYVSSHPRVEAKRTQIEKLELEYKTQLQENVIRLKNQRDKLKERFGSEHPELKKNDAQIKYWQDLLQQLSAASDPNVEVEKK